MAAEVPATGCPMKCVPEVETRKRDVRCYGSVCYNMCYPKCGGGHCGGIFARLGCGHGGCGDCAASCDECGGHKCGHVYTHKYLVVKIHPEEYCVNTCKPVPAPCEEQCPKHRLFGRHREECADVCPPAPCGAPAPYMQGPPVMQGAPVIPGAPVMPGAPYTQGAPVILTPMPR